MTNSCRRPIAACSKLGGLLIVLVLCPTATGQVNLNDLTDLTMAPFGANFQHITVDSTGQLLTRIGPAATQGNSDIYPIDPTVVHPNQQLSQRAGFYWSQFLMIGTDPDPEPGQVADFLTDKVQSEGQTLESFNVLQSSGKVIEYEGTWSFRDLFTTTAHHWVWVEGQDHYHRTRVSLEVLNPIVNVRAIWTELFAFPDAYGTVTVDTRDDGLITQSSLGTTSQHDFGQYDAGPDNWIAFTDPQDGQAGSVVRALLSSQSDIRTDNEVTPLWADYPLFDNIELHVHRQFPGVFMTSGTSFFMDNLMITNPMLDNTDWVDTKIARGKEWIGLIGPPVDFAADFNLDGFVNSADLAQWQGDYGLNGNSDADNDGDSDGRDFLIWQRQFGNPGGAPLAAVPEPTSLLLVSLATVVVGLRTDRHRGGIGRDQNV